MRDIIVEPEKVQLEWAGFTRRELTVHMPPGSVEADLQNPLIWKRLQGRPGSALMKYDRVVIFGCDESWLAEAVVKMADNTSAHLAILKSVPFRKPDEQLWSDGVLKVVWNGSGYAVHRVDGDLPVLNVSFTTEAQAQAAALRSYPTRRAS